MKKIILLILLFIIPLIAKSQTNDVMGEWLLDHIVLASDTSSIYYIMDFNADGNIKIFGIDIASWKYNPETNIIKFTSQKDLDFNGDGKVLKLSENEMVIQNQMIVYYYKKIKRDIVATNNQASGLTGIWRMKTEPYIFLFLKFSEPNTFLYLSNLDGALTHISGNWIFNPEDSSLIILVLQRDFKGKSKIMQLTSNNLTILKGGNPKYFNKIDTSKYHIERLNFSEEDLENLDLNEEQNKLPWQDFELMIEKLDDISKLVYSRGTLHEDLHILTYKTIISNIKINNEKNTVLFTNKFFDGHDTSQFSQNYKGGLSERYNYFFPEDDPIYYRIIGKETIRVPAGEFLCTVVEAIDGDKKVKYWMIGGLPGVYARIIKEAVNPFGDLEYTVNELIEISR